MSEEERVQDTRDRKRLALIASKGTLDMAYPFSSVPVRVPTLVGALPGMTRAATSMMEGWIADANMASVDELLEIARELGVRLFACNTTLGIMRVDAGDLIEGVECVGTPAFLDYAAGADVQLFV